MIIPKYVIPSEKKRDDVRFNIRLDMILASAIEIPSAIDLMEAKKVPNKDAKVSKKVTQQNEAEIMKYIKVNAIH